MEAGGQPLLVAKNCLPNVRGPGDILNDFRYNCVHEKDGRPLPKDPQPSWKGYSVGKWDGDTMVVDTIGFNGRNWLDTEKGRPLTEALHITERFSRLNVGQLEIGITIDDPKAYTKPWNVKVNLRLMPDTELMETVCENARDAEHMVGK